MNRTVLVTGGAGYIGSHVCKRLAAEGWTPVTYDNLSTGHRWAVKWGPLEEGDVNDSRRLGAVFDRHRPAAVMHFAALSLVGESISDPGKYYGNNVVGSLTLLEAMRDSGIDRLVFSSTCAVYGQPRAEVLDEDHPCNPINPYGATKLAIERMIADFGRAHGLKSAVLRYFNASGADPSGEIGEAHFPETHLIPLILQAALGASKEMVVFGDDYDTPDGTCIRDFVHVSDIAHAHVLAMGHLVKEREHLMLNIGTGHGHSVLELVEICRRVTGREIPVRVDSRRPGDPARLVASGNRAREQLGWTPMISDIEENVRSAWQWTRKRENS